MAKFVDLTKTVVITDGGVTIVDRDLTHAREVDEIVQLTLRIDNGQEKFLCVTGAEGAEVSPMSLGLSKIRGFAIELDQTVEIREDGANPGLQRGPGIYDADNTTLDSIKIVNGGTLPVSVKCFIWGDR